MRNEVSGFESDQVMTPDLKHQNLDWGIWKSTEVVGRLEGVLRHALGRRRAVPKLKYGAKGVEGEVV